jgi:hypothetical protein
VELSISWKLLKWGYFYKILSKASCHSPVPSFVASYAFNSLALTIFYIEAKPRLMCTAFRIFLLLVDGWFTANGVLVSDRWQIGNAG